MDPVENFVPVAIAMTLWGLANSLVRVSALLSFKAIFCRGKVGGERMANGLIIVTALHGIAVVLESFLICRPIAAAWDNNLAGTCGDQIVSYVVLEILGLLIDLVIFVWPVWSLADLNASNKSKAKLALIFSSGFVPSLVSLTREIVTNITNSVLIITGLRVQALRMTTSTDFTFSKGYLGLLSVLGCLLSIICCCLPSIAYIFRRLKQMYTRVFHSYHVGDQGVNDPSGPDTVQTITMTAYRGSATGEQMERSYVVPLSSSLITLPSSRHIPMPAEDCLELPPPPPVLSRYYTF